MSIESLMYMTDRPDVVMVRGEGMLRRAGFRIDLANSRGGLAEYLCTKESRAGTGENT